MNSFVLFAAFLGLASAAPGLYFSHETHEVPVLHHTISSPSKTTITKNSHEINHGGHKIVHVPVHHEIKTLVHEPVHTYVHEPVHTLVHEPVHTLVHEPVHTLVHAPVHVHKEPAKSSQYFKLENKEYKTHKVITPVVPVVHSHKVLPVVSYHAPLVTRTGDSAVSHHSSTVHETTHEFKSLPLYALHH